jgi:hypothetical protein
MAMADPTYSIEFLKTGDDAKVSKTSRTVIERIMAAASVYSVTITSTARDAYDQARAMYDNIESEGVDAQKDLYAKSGQDVIDVYSESKAAKKGKNAIINDMKAKIMAIGPGKVSRHCADGSKLQVVEPSSIPDDKQAAWESAIQAEKSVSTYFMPPKDPAYHLEIPQDAK